MPFVAVLAVANGGYSQILSADTYLNNLNEAYVHTFDEFLKRFNSEEFHPEIDYEDSENLRTRSLLSLFDWQRFDVSDSNVAKLLVDFVDTVCWTDTRLDLKRSGIYAEAQCLFRVGQEDLPISIVFVYENAKDDIYKWAVAGVNGLDKYGFMDSLHDGFLNPVQHELRFPELSSACRNGLDRHVSTGKHIDQMSFLLGMLKSGALEFKVCNRVRFHCMQVNGFVFVVDKMNRLDTNSGHLISVLARATNVNKSIYIEKLLGI